MTTKKNDSADDLSPLSLSITSLRSSIYTEQTEDLTGWQRQPSGARLEIGLNVSSHRKRTFKQARSGRIRGLHTVRSGQPVD